MEVAKIVAHGRTWARAGGLGGRVCSCCCLRRSAPPSALEKTRQFMVHAQLEWGALARKRASNTHAPPKPPGPWRPSPQAPTILHTATLRFSSTPGFGVGVMKRPEYWEAGKVGNCENCSAWKGRGPRAGGFGGRVCSCCCLRRSAPHLRWRKHGNSWSTRSCNGGHSRASELPTHTRPPNPPAHGDRCPKRYHSAHSDLEVFISPPGIQWPPSRKVFATILV